MRLGMPALMELSSIEEQAALCRELGLSFVELNMNLPSCLPEAVDPGKLKRLADREGIRFTLHLPEELDVTSLQPSIRRGHLERCREAMEWSAAAGIRTLNMHLNPGIRFTLPDRRVWVHEEHELGFTELLTASYLALYGMAGRLGLQLCIENTGQFQLPFISRALERLSALEGFALTWDAGHDARAGYSEAPVLLRYGDRIRHMHLHDCSGSRDHLPLYTGGVPVNHRLRFALERRLSVVIEVKTVEALRSSVESLRQYGWMGEAGAAGSSGR